MILRVIVTLATLAAVNYIVTAKNTVETVSGLTSHTVQTYRFSNTERLIARGVVGIAIRSLTRNLVPAPVPLRSCDLTATVRWQPMDETAKPLFFLSLTAGGHEDRRTRRGLVQYVR